MISENEIEFTEFKPTASRQMLMMGNVMLKKKQNPVSNTSIHLFVAQTDKIPPFR